MLYIQVNENNDMSAAETERLLAKYNVTVTHSAEIPYMRDGAANLLSVSEVNKLSGGSYNVKQGEYFVIYQYDLKDGYEQR